MSTRTKARLIISVVCLALMSFALLGCSSEAEEPTAPINPEQSSTTSTSTSTLTDAEKLKKMALGETAVWRDYEITVKEIDRADGKLTVKTDIKAHSISKTLSAENLLSFGMPPLSSSFEGDAIELVAGETVSGTFTFDDQYHSQRLFWNDGATEAWWLLDLEPIQSATEGTSADDKKEADQNKPAENANTPDNAQPEGQKQAITALEAEIPSLFTNNTYYTYQNVNSTAAQVKPVAAGGYEYTNKVNILDAEGKQRAVDVLLVCEPNGNCTSMTLEGVKLF